MKANSGALKIAMARACMNTTDLVKAAEMPRPTLEFAMKFTEQFDILARIESLENAMKGGA